MDSSFKEIKTIVLYYFKKDKRQRSDGCIIARKGGKKKDQVEETNGK